ncbi:VOC family protein [Paenilisteria rocourtiae]|uniref:Putative 3-demethylubiquinone-9 3-methyltransferase (Glyoxalase superfamily) n=1 Tax=Listeria rocourtiae TaxID=647910 RepID=A0A4R6ZGX1_9LIST|nr:VOC family protein [Listeria rocourtiae]EUJ43260.1 3-demethylubiquinone-9 3-methyltransferase [Listeria rocourtiae FSL F6-920]MBC1605387.1 VOC family protein [Listeria rocourtiae]TDR51385.1 putative 3-demethylubiquinone-9 3-methyltransferase (glyoxalase superfamily) [Listeria rocourtiae]
MYKTNRLVSTFLTFSGEAEAAMDFYVELFGEDAKTFGKTYIGEADRGETGKLLNGTFEIRGQSFMVMDMEAEYATPFSWAASILVQCEEEEEFDRLFAAFSDEGSVMMGPIELPPFKKVTWVTDKFGVTWQLVW